MQTGWIGGEPDAEAPKMPLTSMILGRRRQEPGAIDTIGAATARVLQEASVRSAAADVREAREDAVAAKDPDEYAANMILRGYSPNQMTQLGLQLADCQAELERERAAIEKGRQRAERVMQMHQRGQIGAAQIPAMLGDDEGDPHRAEMLERRAERLHAQMREAAEATTPPEARRMDPVQSAVERARQALLTQVADQLQAQDEAEERARAQMRRDREAFKASRASRRPFGSGRADAEQERYRAACAEIGCEPVSYR